MDFQVTLWFLTCVYIACRFVQNVNIVMERTQNLKSILGTFKRYPTQMTLHLHPPLKWVPKERLFTCRLHFVEILEIIKSFYSAKNGQGNAAILNW